MANGQINKNSVIKVKIVARGPRGIQGIKGDTGPVGPKGDAATIDGSAIDTVGDALIFG